MSSIDSYEISIPINDNVYIKQIDEYRMSVEDSESGSGSDGEYKKMTYPEAAHKLEKYINSNELQMLNDYIKCKKHLFDHAAANESRFNNVLYILSSISAALLSFLPWFNDTKITCSIIGGLLFFIQHLFHYRSPGVLYNNYSQCYTILLTHFSNTKYVSNATLLKNIETRLEFVDQPVPANYIKTLPTLSSINIFALFKDIENNRNILIRKYIIAENKLLKAKSNNKNVDTHIAKIANIKSELSQLNYTKLKIKLSEEMLAL